MPNSTRAGAPVQMPEQVPELELELELELVQTQCKRCSFGVPPCARNAPNFARLAAKLVCRASGKGCSTWLGLEAHQIRSLDLKLFRTPLSQILVFYLLPSLIWLHIRATSSTPLLKFLLQLALVSASGAYIKERKKLCTTI